MVLHIIVRETVKGRKFDDRKTDLTVRELTRWRGGRKVRGWDRGRRSEWNQV